MPAIEIRTGGQCYRNVVERGALVHLRDHIPPRASLVFVVTTDDVWRLHAPALLEALQGRTAHVLFFPGGEINKRLSVVETLAEQMSLAGADRQSVVLGFGGGIVTDIAGFLAAAFMRGVPVIQIPTTLLAQVDAATGGKTGVNLTSGKNLFGAFHQPLAVLIDPGVLRTLPPRELRAGLYEVIKCGVIRDSELFHLFETSTAGILALEPALIDRVIAAAVQVKADVVSADEREAGLRRILNFGHTAGHALEAETGYRRYLHGEAVGRGMLVATRIAELLSVIATSEAERIYRMVRALGPLPPFDDITPAALLKAMGRDKKTVQGSLRFVLPSSVGSVQVVHDVPDSIIEQALVDQAA